MDSIQLIANGTILNRAGNAPFKHIPTIGSKILYKTFRENKSMTGPVYDISYVVEDILYEVQETWNGCFDNILKIYVFEISRVEVK